LYESSNWVVADGGGGGGEQEIETELWVTLLANSSDAMARR
jgi:hypothetical protein